MFSMSSLQFSPSLPASEQISIKYCFDQYIHLFAKQLVILINS